MKRYSITFCAQLDPNMKQNFGMISRGFKDGHEHFEDDDRAGRPSTIRPYINLVKVFLNGNHRLHVKLLVGEVGLDQTTGFMVVT